MKKTLTFILVLSLLAAVLCLPMSAEKTTYKLIPTDQGWADIPNQGASVTVRKDGGSYIFSGSNPGTWPATSLTYDEPITVSVENTTLKYDFDVDAGNTNITFVIGSYHYPLSNTALGDVNYEAGSGDLFSATYSGSFKLSKLVESKKNLGGDPFDKSQVVDGKLTFTGIVVYSVSGAVITVRKLELVENASDEPDPTESSEDEPEPIADPSEDEPNPPEDSETEPAGTSEEESLPYDESEEKGVETSDTPAQSEPAEASAETSQGGGNEPVRILGLDLWAFILLAAAVVAIIAVVLVFVFSKKKKA